MRRPEFQTCIMRLKLVRFAPVLFSIFLFLCHPAKAQYDGSFDGLYFGRSIDAKSASLGSISRSITNRAFSVHQNAALLGFQEGYSAGYSYSSPFYNFSSFDRSLNYFGISAKPLQKFAFGISSFALKNAGMSTDRLSTLALVYQISDNLSLGSNVRQFALDLGERTDEQGNNLESSFSQWYIDFTFATRFPYQLEGADARFSTGLTLENIFRQVLDLTGSTSGQNTQIELPSIVTVAVNNALVWESGSNFLLTENFSWNLLGEYQNVINHDFRTRFSLGTQVGFNDILFLRAGYFYETLNDLNSSENKSSLSEFTYGLGLDLPAHKITGLSREMILSVDFVRLQQPLLTKNNIFNFGNYSTISVALRIVL